MRQQTRLSKEPAEKVVQDIRRATRKHYSAEEKNSLSGSTRTRFSVHTGRSNTGGRLNADFKCWRLASLVVVAIACVICRRHSAR
jgi:hypothetical protein